MKPWTRIRFLFDYLSPYAYLAWTQVHSLAAKYDLSVEPVPVLLAAVLNAHGTKGPAEVPAEREYLIKDVFRTANHLRVPLNPPPTHPFNPLPALRLTCVSLEERDRKKLIDTLFLMAWGEGEDISAPHVLSTACNRAGIASANALAEASVEPVKKLLRSNTDQAIASGVFGVPSLWVGDELFWGLESFPNLERYLDGQGGIPAELLQKWRTTRSSASRT